MQNLRWIPGYIALNDKNGLVGVYIPLEQKGIREVTPIQTRRVKNELPELYFRNFRGPDDAA